MDIAERSQRIEYYQSWTKERLLAMSEEDLFDYLTKLWAMIMWGNKRYVVDQLILKNGFEQLKKGLAALLFGPELIEARWDEAQKQIKGMGLAFFSELLCHVHPNEFILWNRRAHIGLDYLGVKKLPRYNYQVTGKKFKELSEIGKEIAREMQSQGAKDTSLLAVDYFIWEELQVESNLNKMHKKESHEKASEPELDKDTNQFIHNDVQDAVRVIGTCLGFNAEIEKKVAEGSVVDAVWESSIGNMGRVMYVFEVQTKGSIDSLILNLLKAKNNPAVQGVVAVSDQRQLEKIKRHASQVPGLADQLKFWGYKEVLQVRQSLEFASEAINNLKLVPDGF